jgi:mono/diheme cytochrome c family protein
MVLAVILGLDLGRSILARQAMTEPVSLWKPDSKLYADTPWPPSAGAPAGAAPAMQLYFEHCAICHGPDGRGNGAAAPSMIPRPRDFTAGQFKYKSTPAGTPPSDDDLTAVIAEGLSASAMPASRDILKPDEIRALVGVVRTMSGAPAEAAAPVEIAPRVEPVADSIARGQKLYGDAGCAACHGETLRGGAVLQDAKGYPVVSRDLTAPWTFRGGAAPDHIWLRLTTGLAPGPMPAYAQTLDPSQRWDIVNYILANQRIAPWAPGGVLQGPGENGDLAERGRYLVHAEMCGLCHTEVDSGGIYRDDHYLAGGMRVGALPQAVFFSRNLTSDPETGLGRASVDEIADAIRNGRGLDGRALNFWGMPWMYLHRLSGDDANAIATYLKTLPPVGNAIPLPLHAGLVETIALKLAGGALPVAPPPHLTYSAGSFANQANPSPDRIQNWLILGQWVAALVALAALLRLPSSRRGWLAAVFGVVVAGLCLAVGWFVYATPAIGVLPPDRVADGATGSIPAPDVSTLPPERAAMVRRGQYLFAVASCAYCPYQRRLRRLQGQRGIRQRGPGHDLHLEHFLRPRGRPRPVERFGNRARDPKRRLPRRPAALLAGDALGPLFQLGRRGHPLDGGLSAPPAPGRGKSSAKPTARRRRLQSLYVLGPQDPRARLRRIATHQPARLRPYRAAGVSSSTPTT